MPDTVTITLDREDAELLVVSPSSDLEAKAYAEADARLVAAMRAALDAQEPPHQALEPVGEERRLGREWWEGDDETVSGAVIAYSRTHARLVACDLPLDEVCHEAIRAALGAARRYVVEGPDQEEKG
jgi:hypothetical protein